MAWISIMVPQQSALALDNSGDVSADNQQAAGQSGSSGRQFDTTVICRGFDVSHAFALKSMPEAGLKLFVAAVVAVIHCRHDSGSGNLERYQIPGPGNFNALGISDDRTHRRHVIPVRGK